MLFVRTDYSDEKKWKDIKSIIIEQSQSFPEGLVEFLDDPKYSNITASDVPVRSDDEYFWIIDSRTMKNDEFLLVDIEEKQSVRVVIKEIMVITFGLHDNIDFEGIYDNAINGVFTYSMIPLFRTDFSNDQEYFIIKQKLSGVLESESRFQFIEDRKYDNKNYEFIINNNNGIGYFAVIDKRSMNDNTIAVVDGRDIIPTGRFKVNNMAIAVGNLEMGKLDMEDMNSDGVYDVIQ